MNIWTDGLWYTCENDGAKTDLWFLNYSLHGSILKITLIVLTEKTEIKKSNLVVQEK